MPVKPYEMPRRPEGMAYVKLPEECFDVLETVTSRRRCEMLLLAWVNYFTTGIEEEVPASIASAYRGPLKAIARVRTGIMTGGIRRGDQSQVIDQSQVSDHTHHQYPDQYPDQSLTAPVANTSTSTITSQTNFEALAAETPADPATYPATYPPTKPATFPEFAVEYGVGTVSIDKADSTQGVKGSAPELSNKEKMRLQTLANQCVVLSGHKCEYEAARRELWQAFKSGGMPEAEAKAQELYGTVLSHTDYHF